VIAAGKLNRQLSLFAPSRITSDTGTETTAWRRIATVWGARESLLLREVTRMAGMTEAAEAKFVIRYRAGVTTEYQIECEKRRYSVFSVEEIGNREGLALLVRAI
jgi:SPP1 family predicted phage head-tail adaptor